MLRITVATVASLVAFAANSLLARAALGEPLIDPVSFTAVRLASGALGLVVMARLLDGGGARRPRAGSWWSAVALYGYAIAFSWAYLSLSAGTGALILFGCVQATMIGWGVRSGERPRPGRWLGLTVAVAGLVYLLLPGLEAPEPLGAALMAVSGIAWGIYSLRGRGDPRPVLSTTGNFARSVPLAAATLLLAAGSLQVTTSGLVLAAVSGAVTSGLGYVIWYVALGGLSATAAAVAQLAVPVLAALGGVLVLGESFSSRLAISSVLVLGGVAFATLSADRAA